jgi:hypothetical protein
MFQSINKSQFRDEFARMGRADQFSYDALGLLFDYMEEVSPDAELDVIAICCEYAESTPEEVAQSYGLEDIEGPLQYLEQQTSVVGVTDAVTIVYAQF